MVEEHGQHRDYMSDISTEENICLIISKED